MASNNDTAGKTCPDLLNIGKGSPGVESLLLLKKPPSAAERSTFRVPTSSVLSRVRSFLPRMREAEAELQQRVATGGADSVSIETDDSERPHIEMNLGLCELDSASSDSESDGSASSGGEDEHAPVGPVTAENLRLPGAAARRLVTEVPPPGDGQ